MLEPGHLYQASNISGAVARVWPTRFPGLWHMGIAGYPPRATEEPVPTEQVPETLQEWGFNANGEGWRHWPVRATEVNPDLKMVRRSPNWPFD